mmetsp:Transcript_26971/g.61317  ORF Transcript_26971/g.61317 Transcript_26971/m.61317 type:complete len:167 (-) Transcript_26971:106-606(-)|eukprot:CAMPEP_0197914134 /NCGR_PEP_ID=MMETSP1439-20131203/77946_1 /TAXON_ID=66791 /ORGANISM="Gonyaulax spinifera, Strain CCMP409" /LENGTH=166 /DNA_ID=CAMNT_0043536027 /DNA_START=61 /DNA_END=561 /DNA_ORIENTATION=-
MAPTITAAAVFALAAAMMQPVMATTVFRSQAGRKMAAARQLQAAGLPDPKCSSGVISMQEEGKPQVCCAGYCGECSDYPTCGSVRGQNSTNACCKTQVLAMRCGNAPANVCLKKCTESVPPCIMEDGKAFQAPDPAQRTAGADCNKAVSNWRVKAEAATKPQADAP